MVRKIAKNTLFLSLSQIIARGIGFFYFIFLARVLGVETFGIYNFTLAFIYNFVPVADFGIERLVLRDISRKPEKTQFYFSRLLPLRFLLAIFAYFAALFLGIILGQPLKQIFYLAIFGLSLIPYSLTYLIASFQNAQEKMEYMAMANVGTISLTAFLGITFVFAQLSLIWILLAYVLGQLIIALIFLVKSSSWHLPLNWVVDRGFWRKALSQSWVFAALTILAVFYLRLSLVLVGILKGAYFTGLYGSAFKFIEAMILIPQSLALALFPLSSRLFVNDKKNLAAVYKRGLGVLFLFSLPFSLVLVFFAKWIVSFSYGQDYLPAAPVLSVLGVALVLFFVNALPANIILNSPKVRRFLPLAVLNFLIAIFLCLFLIPRYSVLGAAWAVLGGEAAGLLINNWFVWKVLRSG
ncbi:flippase [Patescibacteria group bacterium]|nr:flippase [Patescibacteria group bacterium]